MNAPQVLLAITRNANPMEENIKHTWRFKLDTCKVDVQMIERWLIMEIDPETAFRQFILVLNRFLKQIR